MVLHRWQTQCSGSGHKHDQGQWGCTICRVCWSSLCTWSYLLWVGWVSFCGEALRGLSESWSSVVQCAALGMVIFSLEWYILLASRALSHLSTAYVLPGTSREVLEGVVTARDAWIAIGLVCLAVCVFLGRFLWVLVLFAIESDWVRAMVPSGNALRGNSEIVSFNFSWFGTF